MLSGWGPQTSAKYSVIDPPTIRRPGKVGYLNGLTISISIGSSSGCGDHRCCGCGGGSCGGRLGST